MEKKILYCNCRDSWTIEGHKYFDVKWVNLLAECMDTTLLWPEDSWYNDVRNDVKKIIYNPEKDINKKRIPNWKIWEKGFLKRLCIKNHSKNKLIIKKVIDIDKENHYDYILISTLDLISFIMAKPNFKNLDKIYVIQHQCGAYSKKTMRFLFSLLKNKIHYIVMESDGIEYMSREYGIKKDRIHYIPHMLNPVKKQEDNKQKLYHIVGISNSNDEQEIKKIIDLEKEDGFFEKNRIFAIFRSQSIEFEDEYLKVFAGRLNLSFQEYYSYIVNAKLILLPFSVEFGLRSSGTIMDAFSNHIPIAGSPFLTMLQYQKQFPNICMTYSSMKELKEIIKKVLAREENYEDEYELFCDLHSSSSIIEQCQKIFV